VLGCGFFGEACSLCLWVAVRAGEEHGGGCTWMNERDYHPTPASTHPWF